MVTLTIENYVKAIYQICTETGANAAGNGEIARRLNVAPGTVTSMLRTLSDAGLVDYQSHRGAALSDAGLKLALHVLRKHRLIELALVKVLGLSWDEVHEEAEHLEHAVSERLIERLDEFLGYPTHDPHGDPIPQADGSFVEAADDVELATLAEGDRFTLVRVLDQSPEFLRVLDKAGFELAATGTVVENSKFAGALVIRSAQGGQLPIGYETARKIRVRKV